MRTLSAGLEAHLAGDAHTLATMLRLDMRDGTSLGITDHNQDLAFDLGDGSITYSASTGILPSDVVLAAGMDSSNFEASGPIGDTVTRAAVLGGRFTAARARLFMVNWSDLTQGPAQLMSGRVADCKVIGPQFTFEIRSAADAFNQVIERVLSPYCTYDFGDAKCTIVKMAYPCTVTAVASAFQFTVDDVEADGFFTLGSAAFLTGALAGLPEQDVFKSVGGAIELYVPLPVAPQIGDTLNLYRGCSKLRKSTSAYSATVNSASSGSVFVIDLGGEFADSFFDGGQLAFLSGLNAGLTPIAITAYVGLTGAVTLASAFANTPSPGDILQIELGDGTVPTCLSWANVVNFPGHPEVPGSATYLKVATPGVAGA